MKCHEREPKLPGLLPAVVLVNPKYPRNVAEAIRVCSCFGVPQLWVTGDRAAEGLGELSPSGKLRLPREERIKLWADVDVRWCDYPFDHYPNATRTVAVEIHPGAQSLTYFVHPEEAIYVFGPEDGSLAAVQKRHCTDFVFIPTKKDEDGKPACLNLYSAVSIMLGDRHMMEERGMME